MANDWKKTAWKIGKAAAIVVITGLIAAWQKDTKYFYLIPILVGGLDYLKHR